LLSRSGAKAGRRQFRNRGLGSPSPRLRCTLGDDHSAGAKQDGPVPSRNRVIGSKFDFYIFSSCFHEKITGGNEAV